MADDVILQNTTVVQRPAIRATIARQFHNGDTVRFKAMGATDDDQIAQAFGYVFQDIPEGILVGGGVWVVGLNKATNTLRSGIIRGII